MGALSFGCKMQRINSSFLLTLTLIIPWKIK
jgi:hypothetical protein